MMAIHSSGSVSTRQIFLADDFEIASQCNLLKNQSRCSFVIFLTFPKNSNPVFVLSERSLQPPKKRSQLHFKQVCDQRGFETRVHRKSFESTRGKHFDNIESFC